MLGLNRFWSVILGVFILAGAASLGYLLRDGVDRFKQYERSVTVKGLSEREYPADVVIWPIQFSAASNDLTRLYDEIAAQSNVIIDFLSQRGVSRDEITRSPPDISDRSAQRYGDSATAEFRFIAQQTLTVYSTNVEQIRGLLGDLTELGKRGIVLGGDYQARPEYLFTRLNEVKPEMIEEATLMAREVAVKFAEDSGSTLGKIRQASQGQFSISDRDSGNPHIKQVRVVSTVEYYLSD